ncbi:hypothetical protein [Algoriphagus winogradskyi]|uniref:Multidrug ABC transporter permease n=1 Tax=Algoriphagus winogradskyi TaxID=237017 RepID=A0ABY1PCH4_9BACT|nr:hypothetical protein [Algoriphagus winogradskyi]SMP31164.1 hypothetical protein SAMN06265367_10740 [Algoriphagus winogradskyi]
MKKAAQIIIAFATFVAVFYFTFWIYGAIISIFFDSDPPKWAMVISSIASFITAGYLAYSVWNKQTNKMPRLGSYILGGALGLGVVGFVLGFFGPLIFTPEANQGPLLGILITGPGGIALGAIAGSIYWKVKKRKAIKPAQN